MKYIFYRQQKNHKKNISLNDKKPENIWQQKRLEKITNKIT